MFALNAKSLKAMKPQTRTALSLLIENSTISANEALQCGIVNMRARICELRRQGVPIWSEKTGYDNKVDYKIA